MIDWIKRVTAPHLSTAFIITLMIPVVMLIYTEQNPFWCSAAMLLTPLGYYTIFASLARRSGLMVWIGFPIIFLSAFQIVLLYLFGNSVIATDMFLNLTTTNPTEAGELLSNIYPAIIFVIALYVPLLWFAAKHIRRRMTLPGKTRIKMVIIGMASLLLGCTALVMENKRGTKEIVRDELFPANAIYNMNLAISEAHNISHFQETSNGFKYHSERMENPNCREIYVLVIGEASRATSWQLFSYDRMTNPLLSLRDDLYLFRNVITQSNTTHKSVPMILSSVHASQHKELYHRTGIPALFNEAGFTTYFISNQSPQGAMIDNLAHDAHNIEYMDAPNHDMQLIESVRKALAEDKSEKILLILHTYGSHFSYHQRYPREFAWFLPDDDVAIKHENVEMIRNAYDNSIVYTDYFLNELIKTLEDQSKASTAIFYCADHGEDLFDGTKKRFLHASPTATYHQLHIASLAWFSPLYRKLFPEKIEAAKLNEKVPATTYSVFHTMADIASIFSPYVERRASLVNSYFDFGAVRYYLNDHNRAVRLNREIGIDEEELEFFKLHNIKP